MSFQPKSNRRRFLKSAGIVTGAAAASQTFGLFNILSARSPNEKLNVAGVGVGGQGFGDLRAVAATENIVALTDVDSVRAADAFETWGKASKYTDFRKMLDTEGKNIDAVVVATPDHMHATVVLACMQAGKHVYCEKPLTRTPWEARVLTNAAEKHNVATQMGNQGYSHDATRVASEIVWSGEIGEVKEVHAWTGRPSWPQGMTKIPAPSPVPSTLDWDLWLGSAPHRPYTNGDEEYQDFRAARSGRSRRGDSEQRFGFYCPYNWRAFHDFGTGLIGDWGVHILGPANWALQLGNPTSVECLHKDSSPPFTFPDVLTVKYDFAARAGMPPVTVYWYHTAEGDAYLPPDMTVEEARRIPETGPQVGPARGSGGRRRGRRGGGRPPGAQTNPDAPPANAQQAGRPRGDRRGPSGSGYNCIFVGSQGYLGTSGRGEGVGLLPGERWAEYDLPDPFLSRSPGASTGDNHSAHVRDWIRAAKGGARACSNFSIAGPYVEWLVLGTIAVRVEGKLEWDAANLRFTNSEKANELVKPMLRPGWELVV